MRLRWLPSLRSGGRAKTLTWVRYLAEALLTTRQPYECHPRARTNAGARNATDQQDINARLCSGRARLNGCACKPGPCGMRRHCGTKRRLFALGRVRETPEQTQHDCRRFASRDPRSSAGENAEAKQAAPTAEGYSAQTGTAADCCNSFKETPDPRCHRGDEAGRHRRAIRAGGTGTKVVAESLAPSAATRPFFALTRGPCGPFTRPPERLFNDPRAACPGGRKVGAPSI